MTSETEKNQKAPPVYKTKVGRVQAAVWTQDTDRGTLYSATFKRSYKNEKDEFRDAFNFTVDDLADLERASRDVRDWITQQS